MKILQIINSIDVSRGGTTTALRNLLDALQTQDLAADIVTTDDLPQLNDTREPFATGSLSRVVRCPRQSRFYSLSLPLNRWLMQNLHRYDLLHIHGLFNFVSASAALSAVRRKVPYVLTPHGMLQKWGVRRRRPLLKFMSIAAVESHIVRRAAALHFTSELEQREAVELGTVLSHDGRSIIIPQGLDLPSNTPALHDASLSAEVAQRIPILFLSRIDPVKRLESLLVAVEKLRHSLPEVLLLIAGDGEPTYVDSLKVLMHTLGIESHVRWLGFVAGDQKTWLLQHARMAVLVSHSENFGFAAVEALAHKVPVLLSPHVGIGELVRKYNAGVICEADPQTLAAHLNAWLTNPQRLRDAGAAGRALVEAELSLRIYGQRMRQLYSKVLTDRQSQVILPRIVGG